MKKQYWLLAVIGLALMTTGLLLTRTVFAHNNETDEGYFGQINDNDRVITPQRDEVRDAEHFQRVDTNHDGKLSHEELTAVRSKGRERANWFAARDKNNDGSLSREECPSALNEHFDKIDADHNGRLSKEELTASRSRR